jgi:hypothetical protein
LPPNSSDDDLGQWRTYGANGRGFAIGFRGPELEIAFARDNSSSNNTIGINYDDDTLRQAAENLASIVLPVIGLQGVGRLDEVARKNWVVGLQSRYTYGGLARVALARSQPAVALAASQRSLARLAQVQGLHDVRYGPELWLIHSDALLANGDAAGARDWAVKAREASLQYDEPTSPSIAAADAALRRANEVLDHTTRGLTASRADDDSPRSLQPVASVALTKPGTSSRAPSLDRLCNRTPCGTPACYRRRC